VQVRVVWRGGATTSAIIRVTVGKFEWLTGAEEMKTTILQMAQEGHSDDNIAAHLTAAGHRSPRAEKVLASTVRGIRLRGRILHNKNQSHPRRVEGFLTVSQLAEKLGVSRPWIYDRIHNGTITVKKDPTTKCYLFPDTAATLAELKEIIAAYQSKTGSRMGHQDDWSKNDCRSTSKTKPPCRSIVCFHVAATA